jgi:tripartite-type tricarboxylate transporter receptor subunit TctC
LAGTHAVHVPYKGAAPALQDLIAGNIQIIYDTVPALLPYIQSGKLRALAVTTSSRLPSLPDVPTTAEAGYPKFLASTWNAIVAPARTPAPIIDTLNRAIVRAVQEPNVRTRMSELSAEPVGSSPDELAAFMKQELQTWAPIVKASGARAE